MAHRKQLIKVISAQSASSASSANAVETEVVLKNKKRNYPGIYFSKQVFSCKSPQPSGVIMKSEHQLQRACQSDFST